MSLAVVLTRAELAGALGQAVSIALLTGAQPIVRCGAWFVTATPAMAERPIPDLIDEAVRNLPAYVRIVSGGAPPQAAPSAPRDAAGGAPASPLPLPVRCPPRTGAGDPHPPAGPAPAGGCAVLPFPARNREDGA